MSTDDEDPEVKVLRQFHEKLPEMRMKIREIREISARIRRKQEELLKAAADKVDGHVGPGGDT